MTEIAAEARSTIDTENRSIGGEEGHEAGIEEHQDDREVKIGGEEGGIPGAQREKKVKVETKKNIEAKTVRVHTEKKILRARKECTLKVVIIVAQIITGKKKADIDQSPVSKTKQSSQDNEVKSSTLKNQEDEKTRSPVEKENQKSKGQENDHVHDKNKKCDHESSPGTDEDKSG